MKVLIADDQAELRSALKILLEQENETYLFEEADKLNSLLRIVESNAPDLLLLDWELSGRSMANNITLLRQLGPNMKIIALSCQPEAFRAALEAGVDAFVSKGENPDKLLKSICSLNLSDQCTSGQ